MSFTAKELETALINYKDDNDIDRYELWCGEIEEVVLEGIGTAKFVEETGHDGDGKYMGSIWRVGDRHFAKGGIYSSWDSSEWDGDFEEVVADTKVVEIWKNIETGFEIG